MKFALQWAMNLGSALASKAQAYVDYSTQMKWRTVRPHRPFRARNLSSRVQRLPPESRFLWNPPATWSPGRKYSPVQFFHTLLVVWWVRSPDGCVYCCLWFVVMVTEAATIAGSETDFMICRRCNRSPDFPVVLGSEIWLHMSSVGKMWWSQVGPVVDTNFSNMTHTLQTGT